MRRQLVVFVLFGNRLSVYPRRRMELEVKRRVEEEQRKKQEEEDRMAAVSGMSGRLLGVRR